MKKYLFLLPIVFLLLPIINIHFALLAVVCMSAPLIFLFKTKSRVFCQSYCPRSEMLKKTKKFSRNKTTPKIFLNGKLRTFFLVYFIISVILIITTTIRVANGSINPMFNVRFLFIIPISELPQLVTINSSDWLIHLSYRFYSMIFTTVIIGLSFSYLYVPRAWCQVCPITSINNGYLK